MGGHRHPARDDYQSSPLSWFDYQLLRSPVVKIQICDLRPAESPRIEGENGEHIQLIAESSDIQPPIIVHRPTMRVIDGMHRLRAAELCGRTEIDARFFDGETRDAFVLAVHANVTHGLPLSLADRVQAAIRIVNSYPQWSDRAIAVATGLSPKTVAAVRQRSAEELRSEARIGQDGRVRPNNTAASRQLAGELMIRNPAASLREIASKVGLAPSTVMDVRARLRDGRDPVPAKQHVGAPHDDGRKSRRTSQPAKGSRALDRAHAVDTLKRDPSLRFSELGRHLLRWLEAHPTDVPAWRNVVDHLPAHCVDLVARLARDSANTWCEVADYLEQRNTLATAKADSQVRCTDHRG
jgi:hypothetical protein